MKDVQQMVKDMLWECGIPTHLKGYQYLLEAITIAADGKDFINVDVKALYREIAKVNCSTAARVESSIRYAINVGWDECDEGTRQEYFGGKFSSQPVSKPSNREFISRLATTYRMAKAILERLK